jgi:hypothetical protein
VLQLQCVTTGVITTTVATRIAERFADAATPEVSTATAAAYAAAEAAATCPLAVYEPQERRECAAHALNNWRGSRWVDHLVLAGLWNIELPVNGGGLTVPDSFAAYRIGVGSKNRDDGFCITTASVHLLRHGCTVKELGWRNVMAEFQNHMQL